MSKETIAAISTPLGEGGIGIVRLSGEKAFEIADLVFRGHVVPTQARSHTVHYGRIVDPETEEDLDEVLLTLMRAPKSYTMEDMVEISCHAGSTPLRRILEATLKAGARLAERGEFTKRAFLNGRIDLAQAEAVVDVVRAKTEKGLSIALSQLQGGLSRRLREIRERLVELSSLLEASLEVIEEEAEYPKAQLLSLASRIGSELEALISRSQCGRMLRDGVSVPIVGRVNVGKSSLLNALLEEDRAIVTPYPGTTRDTLAEWTTLDGFPVKLIDTAGFRVRPGLVEARGVERTRKAIEDADILVLVVDASEPLTRDDIEIAEACAGRRGVLVLNKIDLPVRVELSSIRERVLDFRLVRISATEKRNLEELKQALLKEVAGIGGSWEDGILVTNVRHIDGLRRADCSVGRALRGIEEEDSPELVAFEVREALEALGEITGEVTSDEILNKIFANFCVGK